MDAIIQGDMGSARQIFEQAFWDKVEFRPDAHHLLQAVKRGNREMMRLVITHGATWTADEAKIARLMTGPERWEQAETELRRGGIPTVFSEAELKGLDILAVTRWARRIVEHEEYRGAPDAAQTRREFDRLIGVSMAVCVIKGDMDRAIELLSVGSRADGTAANPFEISPLVCALAARGARDAEAAVKFIDALRDRKLAVKPVTLLSDTIWRNPRLVQELGTRALLSDAHIEKRMSMLSSWSVLQPVIHTDAGPLRLSADYVARQHAALKELARVLFPRDRYATPKEAESFMALHDARLKQSPEALARMEEALLNLGFFDSPAFSVKDLRQLAQTAPTGAEDLATRFNRSASRRVITETRFDKLLSRGSFDEILAAHRYRAWASRRIVTVKIVDYLSAQVKKDAVPGNVVEALRTLRDGGADFSSIDPNRYLGKKAPGLCKTLLDLGIVKAQEIDLERLAKRHNGQLRLLVPRTAREYADHAFMCQVVLEALQPEKFIPLRDKPGVDYPRELIREYVRNGTLRLKFKVMRRNPSSHTGPR